MNLSVKKTISLALFALSVFVCNAAPLTNIPVSLLQPDKDTLFCFVSGDEFYNYLHDKDGYTIIQDPKTGYYVYAILNGDELAPTSHIAGRCNPADFGLVPFLNISATSLEKRRMVCEPYSSHPNEASATDGLANTGVLNNIVIFIRFSDDTEIITPFCKVDSMFNSSTSLSLLKYYESMSYNRLHIHTTFYPSPQGDNIVSFQDSCPRSYYLPYNAVTNPNGYVDAAQALSREFDLFERAVNYINANNLIPITLDVDYNDDGKVDNICFIVKGPQLGRGDLLWPHQRLLSSRTVYINGKRVHSYNLQLEGAGPSSFSVGTFCHEMFHSFGAPDLYHYYNYTNVHPVGGWDLMGSHGINILQHSGAYMKWKYGKWIDSLPEIVSNGTYTLHSVGGSANNNCFIIPSSDPNQWYVVEYRNPNDPFDNAVPGKGLLIYRVNRTLHGNRSYNASTIFDEIYLFRPGASNETEAGSAYYYNQAFLSQIVNRTSFTPFSNPHPFLEGGTIDTTISITNVVVEDSVAHFTYTYHGAYDPVFDVVAPTGQTLRCRVLSAEPPCSVRILRMVSASQSDSLVIPDVVIYGNESYSVTELADDAFANNNHFSTVVLPNSLTSIRGGVFDNCTLRSINIPRNVVHMESSALQNCRIDTLYFNAPWVSSLLNKSSFPLLKVLRVGGDVRNVPARAFLGDTILTSVLLAEGVHTINERAFMNCSKLTHLLLPNSLDSICDYAFYADTCLKNVFIDENVSFMGLYPFHNCMLDTLCFNATGLDDKCSSSVMGHPKVLIIGSHVDSLGNLAFASSQHLKKVVCNEGLRIIGRGAFSNCGSLEEIHLPNSLEKIQDIAFINDTLLRSICINRNLSFLGSSAFSNCKFDTVYFNASNLDDRLKYGVVGKMKNLILGENVRSIPNSAFRGNEMLNRLVLSEGLKTIGSMAFSNCDNLVSVVFPNTLDSIKSNAFAGCSALSGALMLSGTLRYVGGSAFANCNELTTVSLGANVLSVGSNAFPSTVDTVVCYAIQPPYLASSAFSGNSLPSVLLVPCGCVNAYRSHSVFGRFGTIGNIYDCSVNVALNANFAQAGSLSGAGRYAFDSSVVIAAYPNPGYKFLYWNDFVTDNPRVVSLYKDTMFTAYFIAHSVDTLWLHDTTIVNYFIHDTINHFIYDTTFVYDTINYIISHTVIVHDTLDIEYCSLTVCSENLSYGIGAGNGRFPKGTIVEIAAIPIEGYRFVSWNDGVVDNPRTVCLTTDAYYIANFVSCTQSILSPDNDPYNVSISHNSVTIQGAANANIRIFDGLGRCLVSELNVFAIKTFLLPSSGVYLLQIGDRPAMKIVVVK